MNIYEQMKDEDVVESLINALEKSTEKKIFTMRVFGEHEDGVEVVIVYEDKSMMMGLINVEEIDEQFAVTVKGNYL